MLSNRLNSLIVVFPVTGVLVRFPTEAGLESRKRQEQLGFEMRSADQYRVKAAEFSARARMETSPRLQVEYAKMAASYLRLAEMADQNSNNDVVYEPPTRDGQATA
jgi:hypothetical protein